MVEQEICITDVQELKLQQLREQNLLEIIVFIDVMKLFSGKKEKICPQMLRPPIR